VVKEPVKNGVREEADTAVDLLLEFPNQM